MTEREHKRTFYHHTDMGHIKPGEIGIYSNIIAGPQIGKHLFVNAFRWNEEHPAAARRNLGQPRAGVSFHIEHLFNGHGGIAADRHRYILDKCFLILQPVRKKVISRQVINHAVLVTDVPQVFDKISMRCGAAHCLKIVQKCKTVHARKIDNKALFLCGTARKGVGSIVNTKKLLGQKADTGTGCRQSLRIL